MPSLTWFLITSILKRQLQILPHIHQEMRNRCKNNYICVWRTLLGKKNAVSKTTTKNLRGLQQLPFGGRGLRQSRSVGSVNWNLIKEKKNKEQMKQTNEQTNKQNKIISLILTNPWYKWWCGFLTQQYSTNENPSLSRNNFLANLMHGHSDYADPEVAFRKLPSREFFMFYFIASKSD